MDKYVLRKGIGAYSAGTEVFVLTDHPTNAELRIEFNHDTIFTDYSNVVKRRPMSGMVPLLNCKARKAIKREALRNG